MAANKKDSQVLSNEEHLAQLLGCDKCGENEKVALKVAERLAGIPPEVLIAASLLDVDLSNTI